MEVEYARSTRVQIVLPLQGTLNVLRWGQIPTGSVPSTLTSNKRHNVEADDVESVQHMGGNRSILKEAQARQTITRDWDPLNPPPIDGVYVKDVKNVVYKNGVLTELYRPEWFEEEFPVGHVVHVSLLPGLITDWHSHKLQRDIVFPVRGYIRIGLYDGRENATTFGNSCAITFNLHRPRYLHIPTGVWHSLKNIGDTEAVYIVLNDLQFEYDNPDDYVLEPDSPRIPFTLV